MSVLDLTEYGYHSDQVDPERPSLSRSIIHTAATKSWAHAWAAHPKLNPLWEPTTKPLFDIGTVAHQLLLDGVAGVQVVPVDARRGKVWTEAEATARAQGLLPLKESEWLQVEAMMASLRTQLDARDDKPPLFTDGDPEVTIAWEDNGVLCRARLDWLSHDKRVIDDFKTSSNAEPRKFSRGSFFDHGYDLQAAWYMRGVRALFGTDPVFRLAVVEKEAPFQMIVFAPGPDVLELANAKIEWGLGEWKRCLETGVWPGYSTDTHYVTLEPWMEDAWWRRFQGVAA